MEVRGDTYIANTHGHAWLGNQDQMNWYTVLWVVWLVSFGVIEFLALRNAERGDTLSETLRNWLGTTKESKRAHRIIGWSAFLLFAAWFIPHILIGSPA